MLENEIKSKKCKTIEQKNKKIKNVQYEDMFIRPQLRFISAGEEGGENC